MKEEDYIIAFPTGYQFASIFDADLSIYNSNIDTQVIFRNKEVFFATLVTVANVQHLMDKWASNHFLVADMFIVRDLKKETIISAINAIIREGQFEEVFSRIGTTYGIYGFRASFDELPSKLIRNGLREIIDCRKKGVQ